MQVCESKCIVTNFMKIMNFTVRFYIMYGSMLFRWQTHSILNGQLNSLIVSMLCISIMTNHEMSGELQSDGPVMRGSLFLP